MSGITRKPLFWVGYVVLSMLAALTAVRLFPQAIPIVNLDVTLTRDAALAKGEAVAAARHLAPANARTAVRFDHDSAAQNYIELDGGGKPAFARLTRGDVYAPYWWDVRVFAPGVIDEATIFLRPDGGLDGFSRRVAETYVRDPATRALPEDAARRIAETRARDDWAWNLAPYKLIEHSQETQSTGRVDHAFVYERPEAFGEARVRLRLVVAGDELIGVRPLVKVPQGFVLRYEEQRSTNDLIAGIASIAALLLYGVGGVVIGALWLSRRGWLLWRAPVTAGAIVSLLLAAASLAGASANWFGVDTTETVNSFWTKQVAGALAVFVLGALGFGAIFMAAESLSRRAFPQQPQLWRLLGREGGASRQTLGRALGGYLFVPIELALIAVFYYAANRWFGWWQPSEVLTDPNILGSAVPALSPIAMSFEAGMMEECAFRAIPLSLGALIGGHFGYRRTGIVIALVLEAVVFGSAHANYPGFPAYSRPVELFLPALVWGLIFLRFGLLPTIVLHATFDLTLFSIPVFLVDAPGARLQQAMIVVAALAPLWVILARMARAGGLSEMAVGLYNGAWQAGPTAPRAVAAGPVEVHRDSHFAQRFQRVLPVLAVAGLVAFALLARWRADVPSPHIGRDAAIARATQALRDRGVQLGPQWQRMAVVRNASEEPSAWLTHLFVWREAGAAVYRERVGNVLAPPAWDVRFATFVGDVTTRAEEWHVTLGTEGDVRTITHSLPESVAGPSLTREAAQPIAEAELRARFGVDPARLRLVGADESRKPARVDWAFQWADPALDVGKGGEARYIVGLAGDSVSGFGRYVFVPEAWSRAERERANKGRVAALAAALVFIAAGLAGLVVGVMAWLHRRCDVHALWTVGAITLVLALATAANNFPVLAFQLDTAQPVWSQWLMKLLGTTASGIIGGLLAGLLAGVGAYDARASTRLPLAGRLPAWAAGVAGALLVLGVQALLGGIGARTSPTWPPLPQSQWSTLAGSVLGGLVAIPYIGAALFVVHLVSRLTGGFTRRAWLGVGIIVVLQTASALTQAHGQYLDALLAGITGGLVAGAVLWWLIRYDMRLVPAYVAAGVILDTLLHAVQAGTGTALVLFAIRAVVVAGVAAGWMRYLERPLPMAEVGA